MDDETFPFDIESVVSALGSAPIAGSACTSKYPMPPYRNLGTKFVHRLEPYPIHSTLALERRPHAAGLARNTLHIPDIPCCSPQCGHQLRLCPLRPPGCIAPDRNRYEILSDPINLPAKAHLHTRRLQRCQQICSPVQLQVALHMGWDRFVL